MTGIVLGGGVTGLAAGTASGFPVYEATSRPGGICASYWVRPGGHERVYDPAQSERCYRFEIGGGHWIFGGDPAVLALLRSLVSLRTYGRSSAVFFPERGQVVPYPLQDHLHHLGSEMAHRALVDMLNPPPAGSTMKAWLLHHFGHTLCQEFFIPFHELYTVGLFDRIATQDPFKSPVDLAAVVAGAFGRARPDVGYNASFVYPAESLSGLAAHLAARCRVAFDKRAVRVDIGTRTVGFADGSSVPFDTLISTVPLNQMVKISGITTIQEPDPFTSVLVLNIGATRGANCPAEQWLYLPSSRSGFHRVGFYSNVDAGFLPSSRRTEPDRVSIYVERAYAAGTRPHEDDLNAYACEVVKELQDWGFIGEVEVVDPTWIDVAYTWSWPGSTWRQEALKALEAHGILQVGRYGRWTFQGIADSIRDGLMVGAALRRSGA